MSGVGGNRNEQAFVPKRRRSNRLKKPMIDKFGGQKDAIIEEESDPDCVEEDSDLDCVEEASEPDSAEDESDSDSFDLTDSQRSKRLLGRSTARPECKGTKNMMENQSDMDLPITYRRSRRLKKLMVDTFGSQKDTEFGEFEEENYPNSVKDKNHRGSCDFVFCRRSKRLARKETIGAGNIIDTECDSNVVEEKMLQDKLEDDEFLKNAVKRQKSESERTCSVCQSAVANNFFVQCGKSVCFRTFHSFCINPPLQDTGKSWTCPVCQAARLDKNLVGAKRIEKLFGHRQVMLEGNFIQYQLLVKWESLSHHHDCWVPLEWLFIFDRARLHGYRRNHPFCEGTVMVDHRKAEWLEVDRAIACRKRSNPFDHFNFWNSPPSERDFKEFEFLVKWKGLDYREATWESCCFDDPAVSMLIHRHQRAYERINCQIPKSSLQLNCQIPVEIQNGTLYDYQLEGLQWIISNFNDKRNVILADEMGLGKTVQVVCFLHHILKTYEDYPALIVAPKSILFQWEKEFHCWARSLNVIIYQGDRVSREFIQTHELYSSERVALFDVLVTSYEIVQLDSSILRKFNWSSIVIDEAHRMKKLDSKLATCLMQYKSNFRLLLTGTPLQNNLLELFQLLHFIDPDRFSNPKEDAESFSVVDAASSNVETKVAKIHELLKPRMLRRLKSDVLPDLIPTKKWVEVPCALTDVQRELYINILEKNHAKLNKEIKSGKKTTLNSILMALRKCCNHPYLFPGQELGQSSEEQSFSACVSSSGKLQLLEKLLPRLQERNNRVIIFSQMTKMLDILEDFLSFLGMKYCRVDGRTPSLVRKYTMEQYNCPGSDIFVFLMSTRAGGLGVDLPSADRVIIYDPDFNPFMDLQAQSRAHRIGQTRPVVVYQLITKCTVEEKILKKSKQKMALENIVMSSKKPSADELHSMLLHGARTILSREKIRMTAIHYDEEAIENLLKLDPQPGEKCSSDSNGYLGRIVSFSQGTADIEEPPQSPRAGDWEAILGNLPPPTPKVNFLTMGRGKRQKKAVKYYEDQNSDSDDAYAPEASGAESTSGTESSSSGAETSA